MYINKVYPIFFILAIQTNCLCQLKIGTSLSQLVKYKYKAQGYSLVNSSDFYPSSSSRLNGIKYVFCVDKLNKINFVWADDRRFIYNHLKVNQNLSYSRKLINKDIKIKKELGWGLYFEIDTNWFANMKINKKDTLINGFFIR